MGFEGKGIYGSPVESSYETLLKTPEWISRRKQLLVNPNNSCELCNKSDNGIEIHHKYYVRGRLPWEYPDNCFMILCESCHKAYHKLRAVPIYSDIKNDCIKYDFDRLSFTSDYKTGNWGLEFLKKTKRVAFIWAGDETGIWLSAANRTIGQLIYGLNLKSIRLPSIPGRLMKKKFSNDHIEYHIEGWSKELFLLAQQKLSSPFENFELAMINLVNFVQAEILWTGVTGAIRKEPVTGRMGFLVIKEITARVLRSRLNGDLLNPTLQDQLFIPIGHDRKTARCDKQAYDVFAYRATVGSFGYKPGDIIWMAK